VPVAQGASQNSLAYVKGIDFNSQNKYDYDVISNMPRRGLDRGESSLRLAAA
jgi:hypothetical protein